MQNRFSPCRIAIRLATLQPFALDNTVFHRGGNLVFLLRASLAIVISAALIMPPAFASRVHRAPTSGKTQTTASKSTSKTQATAHKASGKRSRKAPKKRGQLAMEPERVSEIQQALIREHYLSGDVTGKWDGTTQAAMQKYQADQGWQTKLMPDSRAIKKLGLGPDYSNAINAPNSSFAPPPPISTIPTQQAAGFAAAAGVNQQ
jgi:hypothetical protein